MQPCDTQVLSAYLDHELDPRSERSVEAHLRQCPDCAQELRSLTQISDWASNPPIEADLTPGELAEIHDVVDESAGRDRILRWCGVAGVIAASILVISGAWLAALPDGPTAMHANLPLARATTPEESWEELATTLQVQPNTDLAGQTDHALRVADARFADWMLNSLDNRMPP
jgi:anti-sigma factor RsiW